MRILPRMIGHHTEAREFRMDGWRLCFRVLCLFVSDGDRGFYTEFSLS